MPDSRDTAAGDTAGSDPRDAVLRVRSEVAKVVVGQDAALTGRGVRSGVLA